MDGAFWLWGCESEAGNDDEGLELAPVSVRLSNDRIAFNPIRLLAEERVPCRSAREVP